MEAYLLDWANLLLRWVHVITAIAWIGSSFYFVFLDNNLLRPNSPDLLEKGVDGAMWAVHDNTAKRDIQQARSLFRREPAQPRNMPPQR